jgi:hypothetical protein
MQAPTPPAPTVDPLVTQAEQTAQNQLIIGLQTTARSDTASLMAQYGALASAFAAPGATPSTALTGGFATAGAGKAA